MTAEKIEKRRSALLKVLGDYLADPDKDRDDVVWAKTELLQKALDCSGSVDDDFHAFKVDALKCPHDAMTPETARSGKVLPLSLYQGIMRAVQAETERQLDEAAFALPNPSQTMSCDECSNRYQAELRAIVRQLKKIRTLFVWLDPHRDKDQYPDKSVPDEEDPARFIISASFVTAFRNRIGKAMKEIANGSLPQEMKNGALPCTDFSQGASCVDLTMFGLAPTNDGDAEIVHVSKSKADDVDIRVNSKIACACSVCLSCYRMKLQLTTLLLLACRRAWVLQDCEQEVCKAHQQVCLE